MVDFSQLVRESARKGRLSPSLTVIEQTWDVLVGPEVAQHVMPVDLRGSTLVVKVRPHWVKEWTRHKPRILKAIGQYVPGIHDLDFEEGELPMTPIPSTVSSHNSPTSEDIDSTFQRIIELVMKERQ